MTTSRQDLDRLEIDDWRRWLRRVERRTDAADVPLLLRRLEHCLDVLERIRLERPVRW